MSLSKYLEEDLDNDLEAIFADMMDEGFLFKKTPHGFGSSETFNIIVVKSSATGGLSFDIKPYKDHFKQLLAIIDKKGIQIYSSLVYLDGRSTMINDVDSIVDSILKDTITTGNFWNGTSTIGTDFRGKTFEEFWDGLTFTIYCNSEKDIITNLTMAFCEK